MLLDRVRALRQTGSTPKQIARALGIPPARAKALIKAVAAAQETDPCQRPVVECWVSRGWSQGLTVAGPDDWRDDPPDDAGTSGLVGVLVARDAGRGRVSTCGYLVDVYCLGVKNSLGPRVMDHHALPAFVRSFFEPFAAAPLSAPFELAQHLVLGAVEYARKLGFEPMADSDFDTTSNHLGRWEGPRVIEFGRDSKPYYVAGPRDNPDRVMRTLEQSVGKDNFHFLVGLPA